MRKIYLSEPDTRASTPFSSPEEAWFWYCLCAQLGFERARGNESKINRPCESSDIIRAVKNLLKTGILRDEHIQILTKYGGEQTPPHENFGATRRMCLLWREAMKFLGIVWRKKGIIA